ncbi:site-specific integrase [Cesiribacter sp. SM1]|uniref:site-specific integrase n=1 Tax=Cesiribacter sp. SM1 TaxID=2861196 RepID=UPI001CD77BFF|nr:site-specific integrase [Cesiribacter sp. SM1]
MSANLSLKFYLNEDKLKGDKVKIYLRITYARKKAEIATAHAIAPADWDEAKQRSRKNPTINQALSDIEAKLYQIKTVLEYEERPVSARILKDVYIGKDKIAPYLIEFYQEYMDEMENHPERSSETVSIYKQTFNYVKAFVKSKYRASDILIKQIDFKFVKDLDLFLLKNDLSRNTVIKHHSRFRTLLYRAINEGYLEKNPYKDFKMKKEQVNREELSEGELERIIEHDLHGNESLQRVRDLFIFSVYTGLRYQDAQDLEMKHIVTSDSGKQFIKMKQHKTGEIVNIPLLQPALDIIDRYDNKERKITGKVLPRLSNQKLNVNLKEITKLVGIQKNVTHHVARHTFATTILRDNDIPLEIISNLLGHTNIKQTKIYAKNSDRFMEKLADQIETKIKKK